jgi:hypothetical protein
MLEEEVTPSEGTAYARTFSCRVITADGQLPSDDVPERLCVKLFPSPTEYLSLAWWAQEFYTAEDMIQNKINVYMRLELEHAWGSSRELTLGIGASFTLNFYLYGSLCSRWSPPTAPGVLVEYVAKPEKKLEEQSEVAQFAFVHLHSFSASHFVNESLVDTKCPPCCPRPPIC